MANMSIWKETKVMDLKPAGKTKKKFRPANKKTAMEFLKRACMEGEKLNICLCGIQLKTLSMEDLRYIAKSSTTEYAAQKRLRSRRLSAL